MRKPTKQEQKRIEESASVVLTSMLGIAIILAIAILTK